MSDRLVRRIFPAPKHAESPQLFSLYSEHPNIVLLGDPGAGKTHLFSHFAGLSGGNRLLARDFLILDQAALTGCAALFIDALDEKRAGRGDQNTIDAIVSKLFAVKPAHVRIACRAADWLGDTDLAAFKLFFDRNGGCQVLSLEPLTPAERLAILQEHAIAEPQAFVDEAQARGLEELLANPQNLIMLADVVRNRGWPSTRTELYRQSTELLLLEHNATRSRTGSGVYSPAELAAAAGALCAARLIGDVDGISLAEASADPEFPSYRGLAPLCGIDKVQSALGRRVFMGDRLAETVDYAHRTIAEYLGAAWLANQVREGLPIGRVCALIGVDGRPASELRGLHAWLAVLLPEHAARLIDVDPFGVLSYGDVAALSTSHRHRLLEALGVLAQSDPWFRGENRSSANFAALSSPDMVPGFRRILDSREAGFALRSVVLDALAAGGPMPDLQPDLLRILMDKSAPYAERSNALDGLFRMGEVAQQAVASDYRKRLGGSDSDIRLRAEILGRLYGKAFAPCDVIELLAATMQCTEKMTGGILWYFSEAIPDRDIAEILSGIQPVDHKTLARAEHQGGAYEVRRVFERLLLRFLKTNQAAYGDTLWKWLLVQNSLSAHYHSGNKTDEIKDELSRRPALMREVIAAAVASLEITDHKWLFLDQLRKATVHAIDENDLLEQVAEHATSLDDAGDKQAFLYEAAIALSFRPVPRALDVFTRLYDFAEDRPRLRSLREQWCFCPVEGWRVKDSKRRAVQDAKRKKGRATNIRRFAKEKELIRSGSHVGWLSWIARVYLALFMDVQNEASAEERLAAELGASNVEIALEALVAGLRRDDIPTLQEVADSSAAGTYYEWWYAIVAGMTEYARQGFPLETLSDDLIRSVLAIDCAHPTYQRKGNLSTQIEYEWKSEILAKRPELARDAYLALARASLLKSANHIHGLYQLMNAEVLQPYRADIAIQLLREVPQLSALNLETLLTAALGLIERDILLDLVRGAIDRSHTMDDQALAEWLGAAYLLAPDEFHDKAQQFASGHSNLIWVFRTYVGLRRRDQNVTSPSLSIAQMELIARMAGQRYGNCDTPTGGSSGNTNPWDAAEFVQALANRISADPSAEATQALMRLRDDNNLESYRNLFKHVLAVQQVRALDAAYRQPSWNEAITALANGAPANVADLQALIVAHLRDLKIHIASNNTDIYKLFWNENGHGKIQNPKGEESCRDVLVDLLRTRVQALNIRIEPEGHMVEDKRADMVALLPGMKLAVELKRDYHSEVWSAVETQLDRFYTRDPEAQGFGIYGVFWYGPGEWLAMPLPPGGGPRPQTAAEMEVMLHSIIPVEKQSRLTAIVIDVSKPTTSA